MVASIALGVAIVAAIHWIDASALYSFQQGVDALLGRGDTTLEAVQGPLADGLLPEVRQIAEVEAAFPALEMELVLEG